MTATPSIAPTATVYRAADQPAGLSQVEASRRLAEREDRGMSVAVQSGRRPRSRIVRASSARARASNQRICAVVRTDTRGELPFVCECGLAHCHSSVWLTLQEGRDLIESGGLIIGAHFFVELEARLADVPAGHS